MELQVIIKNIKAIHDLSFALPLDAGLYAITGLNGSGKSTIVESISSVLFKMSLKDHCGTGADDASIELSYNGMKRIGSRHENRWRIVGDCKILGFYEGNLIFGTRFRNNSYASFKNNRLINKAAGISVDDFVKSNMGYILHGDKDYYEKICYIPIKQENPKTPTFYYFYYEKNGKEISQYYMSTGENLLLNILFSLYNSILSTSCTYPRIVFLDEIEMALHPLSLKRLSTLLQEIAITYNCSIYLSTHSIELIHGIKPANIFYIQKEGESFSIIKNCYPAYVTRNLYTTNGYDRIILVEDILAKNLIERIIREKQLLSNGKLVCVVPVGGWSEMLYFAKDAVANGIFGNTAKVIIILDGDCQETAKKQMKNMSGMSIPLNFLPISSLEKYLRNNLIVNPNYKFKQVLADYVFRRNSLDSICEQYRNKVSSDNDSKKFYKYLEKELVELGMDGSVLCEETIKFLIDTNDPSVEKLTTFLHAELS